ncbi:hypothetical protein TEA_021695 [Camellia sinensis var. sinensis]|uniref:Terpene synthase metal-binding domain-containing protein n=1 Tax=Camellia sinensis var. sinensis TaxID=542762 RepID=A0A4S4E6Q5_CAMSN|nr:hypothetical protein TEA_021695 [Camellia sinensis var. sinensis]
MNSMLREAKWVSDKSVPTRDAYMTNGFVLFALGPIVLPALYLVGPVLSEEVVCSFEYKNLYKRESKEGKLNAVSLYMVDGSGGTVTAEESIKEIKSIIRESKEGKLNVVSLYMIDGRGGTVTAEESIKEIKSIIRESMEGKLNAVSLLHMVDGSGGTVTAEESIKEIKSIIRESMEGKLNAISLLHMVDGSGGIVTAEESIKEIKSIIVSQKRELLRLVLQEKGSLVPRACKDLFWKMVEVLSLFYMKDDGFTSHEMINAMKKIIYESIGHYES